MTNKAIDNVRLRAAPSPTGYLHVGNLRTFLYCYLYAKSKNGKFILRIENTDRERIVPKGIETIIDTLKLYGITFDEGPHVGGPYGPYIQSKRLDLYKKYAHKLVDLGYTYYCFCSPERLKKMREEQQKRGERPRYDRKCRNLSIEEARKRIESGEKYVVRLKVPLQGKITFNDLVFGKISINYEDLDDQILLKSDGYPTYHFAVVIDDHLMNITHVVRDAGYLKDTPKNILIYNALKWKTPIWAHMPLILNPDGKGKLSKRKGALPAVTYLKLGYLPEAVLNFLALIGWAPPDDKANKDEVYTLQEMAKLFDLANVHNHSGRYDTKKLDYLNGKHIRKLSIKELSKKIFKWTELVVNGFVSDDFIYNMLPYLKKEDENLKHDLMDIIPFWEKDEKYFYKVLELVRERLVKLSELPSRTAFFYKVLPIDNKLYTKYLKRYSKDILVNALTAVISAFDKQWNKSITHDKWEQIIRSTADKFNMKHGDLFMLMRIAITFTDKSPPLFEVMQLLDWRACKLRIAKLSKVLI